MSRSLRPPPLNSGAAPGHPRATGLLSGLGQRSAFLRFYQWLLSRAQCSSTKSLVDSPAAFPCHLPFHEVCHAGGPLMAPQNLRQRRLRLRMQWVNQTLAMHSFFQLGCPTGEDGYAPLGPYAVSTKLRHHAERLLSEGARFGFTEAEGRSLPSDDSPHALYELLSRCEDQGYEKVKFQDVQAQSRVALPARPHRVAVPARAGLVDPRLHLSPAQLQTYDKIHTLLLPEFSRPPLPRACHKVPPKEEEAMMRKLLESGVAELVKSDLLPRGFGYSPLAGGLFAVKKSSTIDRLIYDRRPQNSQEQRIRWETLPSASCFNRVLLGQGEFLRGTGTDLSVYYYHLRQPPERLVRNAVGRPVSPALAKEWGKDPATPHHCCFRVWGMGDLNASDVGQAVHVGVLRGAGGLPHEQTLEHGRPLPRGRTLQGVYQDDYLIAQKVSYAERSTCTRDLEALDLALSAYQRAGLEVAGEKTFVAQANFKAWGNEIRGHAGISSAPETFRRTLWLLTRRLLAAGCVCKPVLDRVLGLYCHAFQARRELLSLMHHVYKFASIIADSGWVKLPAAVQDELRSMALHLPVAHWRMRRPIAQSVWATDATPTAAGATEAECPPALARALFRHSEAREARGQHVRLDGSSSADGERMLPAGRHIDELAEALPWHVRSSYSFKQLSHINLQEARAVRNELRRELQRGSASQVCVGAFSKGRTSSYKLNGISRRCLGLQLLTGISLASLWVSTKANPADAPSRWAPLPKRKPWPQWALPYVGATSAAKPGLEVFAGSARLTHAHRERGLATHPPYDILYGEDYTAFSPELDRLLRSREVGWLWLALPCGSFSALRNLDPGSPLWPKGRPQGDDSKPEVRLGNSLWRRALALARLAAEHGIPVTIEHPAGSKAWLLPETHALVSQHNFACCRVDWCQYDSSPLPAKKPTRLITTAPWIPPLCCTCQRDHQHGPPLRGHRAKLAAAYPPAFCRAVATAYAQWEAEGRPHSSSPADLA